MFLALMEVHSTGRDPQEKARRPWRSRFILGTTFSDKSAERRVRVGANLDNYDNFHFVLSHNAFPISLGISCITSPALNVQEFNVFLRIPWLE